ncbi:protein TRC8-like protein [Dinothrombium tinctorium]|uniref:Protein TRC8-like protein n=1 Tax=Dinothrombium tinctorium TaxID=1965070 RepID=A0A3S3Q8N3_9ACAR|nr:protein TRC8-like protein [Dinothrombium tinctorium]RWS05365.1 protein TRC8-like protein [Dinothrombium tinctorium]
MSLRTKLLSILDVVLRVPPIFAMDSILVSGFSAFHNSNSQRIINLKAPNAPENLTADQYISIKRNITYTLVEHDDYSVLAELTDFLGWILIYSHVFLISFAMFLLPTKHLISVYVWLSSIGVIVWSYICNEEYVRFVNSLSQTTIAFELLSLNFNVIWRFLGNYLLQVFLAILFCFASSSPQKILPKRMVGLCFIIPTVLSLLPRIPNMILMFGPIAAASVAFLHVCLNVIYSAHSIFQSLYGGIIWSRTFMRHYGLYTLLENQWTRLHVPQVLRVFWLTRLTEQAVLLIADSTHEHYLDTGVISLPFDTQHLWITSKQLMMRGCETVIAVLGMTSVVSSICYQIGSLMQSFLLVEDPEDRSIGTVSAILFFILALQTGLTGMEPEKRLLRLYRNLCLVSTAILHFIHNMVSPLLFSLSASRNMSINRHGRALLVCLFLVVFPIWFLSHLWSYHPVSTWLLAVSAFSVEVIIKVVMSLLIYGLFMIDAYRSTIWEQLDDYVYYIKATGSTVEFIIGIFLFFNGAWILLFESGGTIRALMMCVHAYFNIWLQAKSEATEEQLRKFDDVCAICYQELNTARITRCNHYFHGVCLRKWLYVQDICPLCHETLYAITEDEANDNEAEHDHMD